MKYHSKFADLNAQLNKNNKFYGNIPKVNFNISALTYVEDMRKDVFI